MTLTITDDAMTGSTTTHTAHRINDDDATWTLSWYPSTVDRDHAVTGMLLAERLNASVLDERERLYAQTLAGELGLDLEEAAAMIHQVSSHP